MCENRSRIRVFDLCPIVSRSHGFAQTKTDRTKKEEKTKQRTESKQRPKQRTDRKERKTIGSGTGVDKKSKEAQCFHSNAVFTKLSPFFCLDAAWLNEGRCPGGRPSVTLSLLNY